MHAMSEKVIIIGGGLGGLFTGAILAKEGYEVTVLEKNSIIGGGLQNFKRYGETFETGMHILGGLQQGGNVNKILTYLGIEDLIETRMDDSDCITEIKYLSDGKTYHFASGRDGFVKSLSQEFPDEADNLKAYIDELYKLADEVDLYHLRPDNEMRVHSDNFMKATDVLIAEYIKDEKLRDVLAYVNPTYGGVKGHTPAYIHALIQILYIEGQSRFVGGSQQLANALKSVVESHNGAVYANKEVLKINVVDRVIQSVETTDGSIYVADKYISAIHPCTLLELMDEGSFPKSFTRRLQSIPNSYSAFTVYFVFKENKFPYLNYPAYIQDDYGQAWEHADDIENNWPRGFMYITPCDKDQGKYASKMIINCLMKFDYVKQWEDTTVGRRGKDYYEWKLEMENRVIAQMEKVYPDFRDCIKAVFSSSPLTIRDYYHVKEGSLYGFRKDCNDIALSHIMVNTKVSNLLLTGQNVNLHGICGVPLTAVSTVEMMIGRNAIRNKINEKYNEKYGNN